MVTNVLRSNTSHDKKSTKVFVKRKNEKRRDALMQVCLHLFHFSFFPGDVWDVLADCIRRVGGVDPRRQPGASLHSISTPLTHTWTHTHWWRWDLDRLRDGKTEEWELMQVRRQRYKLKSIHISSIRCKHQVQVEIVQQETASQGTAHRLM